MVDNNQLKKIFSPIWNEVSHIWTKDIFKAVFKNIHNDNISQEDYINHSLYFECKTFLHSLLIVEDKLGMAHSLETRFPFLDNDIVNFAMKCPINMKLQNLSPLIRIDENEKYSKTHQYFMKTNDGKKILRKLSKKYFSEETSESIKQGFSAPDRSWFKGKTWSEETKLGLVSRLGVDFIKLMNVLIVLHIEFFALPKVSSI